MTLKLDRREVCKVLLALTAAGNESDNVSLLSTQQMRRCRLVLSQQQTTFKNGLRLLSRRVPWYSIRQRAADLYLMQSMLLLSRYTPCQQRKCRAILPPSKIFEVVFNEPPLSPLRARRRSEKGRHLFTRSL